MVSELTGDEPELKLGDSGEGVMLLQVRLYALGLYPTIPDGTFDMATENAVRDLQSQLGQDNDGEVTRQTWEAVVYLEQQYGVNYQYQSPYDALAQLQFDRERPELSSGQYRSEPGSMSEDGQWQWDGSSWQSVGEPPAQDSYVGQLSPDGHWQWDGNDWQPAGGEQVAVHDSYIGQLSPDGYWRWDGQEWQVA
ncbi:MAG TPA: peptidoglycan-binding domain-containing protein [Jatrophihabitans sp.]|nr:peptidoglycan-binding domain-containing protein [Jatrophihabitans sp.]